MLSESFVAASSSPPKVTSSNSTLLKDAGIFLHTFQPQPSLRSTFKKSVTASNCIVISSSHVFAAQSEKAVVHVYNREKGNHEATIPFPERIHSLVLACDDTVLALGTAGGNVVLWELCTGRLLSTSQSHLQPVKALAVDLKSNFLLSGSADSNVHVWSLLDLLSFPSTSAILSHESTQPRYTFSGHRSAIAALVTGHSAGSTNIAISASEDQTAIVWNYHSGDRLRTFLLPSTPLCMAIDPADRSFYVGYNDGSVQFIPFYSTSSTTSIHNEALTSAPIQPPPSTRHHVQSVDRPDSTDEADATLSLALSHDGTTLLTGHTSGKINSWSITTSGDSITSNLAQYGGAPITNIQFLPLEGWPNAPNPKLKTVAVVKPKPHESFSGLEGQLNGSYTFTAQFPSACEESGELGRLRKRRRQHESSDFGEALASPLFPRDMLDASVAELSTWNALSKSASTSKEVTVSNGLDGSDDFVSFDRDDAEKAQAEAHNAEHIAHLEKQISHLRKLQDISHKHVADLVKENEDLTRREEEASMRKARRMKKMLQKSRGTNGSAGLEAVEGMDVDAERKYLHSEESGGEDDSMSGDGEGGLTSGSEGTGLELRDAG